MTVFSNPYVAVESSANWCRGVMQKTKATKSRKGFRKHNHFRVTVTYRDNEISGRVYSDREKAEKFAARQKRSPFVKSMKVEQID
jgi:hypothetical protein